MANSNSPKRKQKRHYYFFDNEQKEYIYIPLFQKRLRVFLTTFLLGLLASITVVFIIILSVPQSLDVIITSKLISQQREIQNFRVRFEELNKKLDNAESTLSSIAQRDKKLYRITYDANPLPEERFSPGYGGADRYSNLEGYQHSDILVETSKRLDMLLSDLAVQNSSLKELESISEEKEVFLKSVPSIIPIKNDQITRFSSGFGYRKDPFTHQRKMHRGVDFTVKRGTPIYATGDGIVERVSSKIPGYGKHIKINHGFGYQSLYAHLSKYNVRKGQKIQRGDLIGYSGNTGRSTGPHLHYEIIKDGIHQNPIHFYYGSLSPEEFDAIISKSTQYNKSLD
ncbi:MAG: M23 family metallopeptidase [Flavobacteriaceae bacterium]|nr:M23 family metallopeptidase [Flavobacteriaceae bacterium]MCY4267908.1 M23 family metallopeptidase [Flavobacteriaceae bacterium]MCY4298825.1 M23 family metallopeptidase [Flavobacteriaceae bacterium]